MDRDKILELLETADWKKIIPQLTHFALSMAKKYTWKFNAPDQLSKGKTPEDIACEAIDKVWQGIRAWDPEKYPNLLTHLMWIVRSDTEHLYCSDEHKKTERFLSEKSDEDTESTFNETSSDITTHHVTLTPEEELLAREGSDHRQDEKLKELLHNAVKGDEDLELLVYCLENGIEKPKKIAAETGWSTIKTNDLKRKLLRRTTKINKNMKKGEEL